MKAAQLTPAATPAKKNTPFFNKKSEQGFFHSSINEQPFFSKAKNNNYGIQAKLTVGAPNDVYEKEADSMADKVVQRLAQPEIMTKREQTVQAKPFSNSFTPFVQRKCAHCEKEEKLQKKENEDDKLLNGRLQKKPIFESNAEPPDDDTNVQQKCAKCEKEEKLQKKSDGSLQTASSNIESSLSSSKGSGTLLPKSTRDQMENSFGADFSKVRIHSDSSSVQMSKNLNAQAFTHGNDIYFNQGKYDTNSTEGKHLLAHELTHTVQQNGFNKNNIYKQSSAVIQKQSSPKGALPALSPEELLNFLLTQRGFGTSKPGVPTFDPKGIGKPTGKGYQTYAAIQIIDKEGKQIKVSTGAYLSGGDLHGEVDAITNLRNSLPQDAKLGGGKMMVAVEQLPCPNCDSSIKSFAKELGVSEYSVYVPQRESIRTPGAFVKPKTAATGAFQGGRGPTTARLLVSETLEDISSSASKAISAEAKVAAKEAVATLETDLKMLRVATFLKTSLAIISGILDILNAVDFFNMAENKLSGGAFILNNYLKDAEELDVKADILNNEYPNVSDKLSDMQLNLLKAIGDMPEMGKVTLQVLDSKIQLQQMQIGLDERIKNISAAIKEANAKEAAAMKILEDPVASASIAMATFGTGELARLFAVSQDLQLISGKLSTALVKFKKVKIDIDEDVSFLQSWYDYFLILCKGDPACKMSLNEGWYQIVVISAKVPDSIWDTPDTYVSFPKNGLKTSVKDDTTNPAWNEVVGLWRMDRLDENISIRVYDYDPISSDDLLGSFDVNLKPSNPEGETFTLNDSDVSLIIRVARTLHEPS